VDRLVRIAALPLLLMQARQVRRDALILPEAAGPRSGEIGDGPPLRLLILGDSSAAGVGAEHQDQALAGQLAQALSRKFRVEWEVLARTGATSADALEMLTEAPATPVDVAVIALGVNDVTGMVPTQRWLAQQQAIVTYLEQTRGAGTIYLSALPPMRHFPLLPNPLRWVLGRQAERLEAARARQFAQHGKVIPIKFTLPLDPKFMAPDGFHPSPETYRIWAETLADTIIGQRQDHSA
jgi:lysophospholipase L1-like esterase